MVVSGCKNLNNNLIIFPDSKTFSPLAPVPDFPLIPSPKKPKLDWRWEVGSRSDSESKVKLSYSPIMIVFFVVAAVLTIVALSTMGFYVYHWYETKIIFTYTYNTDHFLD